MRAWLNTVIDRFQAKFPPNRLAVAAMVVLVPLAATPIAGYIAQWAALHLPGTPGFGKTELIAAFSVGALSGLTAAVTGLYKFVDGWQKDEHHRHVEDMAVIGYAQAERDRFHEKEVALINASSSPFEAIDAIEQLMTGGGRGEPEDEEVAPAPDSPSAAVGDVQPPPPPSPVAEHRESPPAPSQPPQAEPQGPEIVPPSGGGPSPGLAGSFASPLLGPLGQPPGPPWPDPALEDKPKT